MDQSARDVACAGTATAAALAAARVGLVLEVGRPRPPVSAAVAEYLAATGGHRAVLGCASDAHFASWSNEPCAWIVSGVANYYDTYRQLLAIDARCSRLATPLLVLFPQLAPETARRDLYCGPRAVPEAWRQPSATHLRLGLVCDMAIRTGGPRNGVLTAIEDVTCELADRGTDLALAYLPAARGFCAVFDSAASWAPELADRLARFHTSTTLAAMTDRQVAEYLAILGRTRRDGPPSVNKSGYVR